MEWEALEDEARRRFGLSRFRRQVSTPRRLAAAGGTTTLKDLVAATALPERKVKMVVALLDSAGVIERGRKLRKRRDFQSSAELESFLVAYEQRHSDDRERLKAIMRYAEMPECRTRYLRTYFGETAVPARCGHCDNCRTTADSVAALAASGVPSSSG